MKVDVEQSRYHEDPKASDSNNPDKFNRRELRSLRLLLRRLRFLETKLRDEGGLSDGAATGGAAFTEWEVEALEYVLTEIGFLKEVNS